MVVSVVVAGAAVLGGVATVVHALSPARRLAEFHDAQHHRVPRPPAGGGTPREIDLRGARETSRGGD